jgi:hypothetical protein
MANALTRQDHLAFLSELTATLREVQSRPGLSAEERRRYQRWVESATALGVTLDGSRAREGHIRSDDDLPAALLKELRRRKPDPREAQILSLLEACGGSADLDQILIALYRAFGVIEKRRVLQNKLWRLVRKERIVKAKDTRNVFCLGAAEERGRRGKRKR